MTTRIPCKSPGCTRTILPATAERTGGFCMPCVQEKAQREYQAYVRANRRDENPYEGVEDPLELIKRVHAERPYDPLIRYLPCPRSHEDLYAALDPGRMSALIEHASELVDSDVQRAEDIARCLAAFTDADINALLARFVAADLFYPGLMFLRADEDIREALIHRLLRVDAGDQVTRKHLLTALAWIGDSRVVELFGQWRKQPPRWREELFVPPEDYARVAGWEVVGDSQRRDLYHRDCFALVRKDAGMVVHPASDEHRAVLRLLECEGRFEVSTTPRSPWHAADPFLPTAFSQIGGHPAWVQDAEYPSCSECAQTMTFVGQVALDELEKDGDGTCYAFVCKRCSTTATSYQCT